MRVATFGTSLTANGGWQSPLADALEACVSRPVDVGNQGRAGAASNWGVTVVDEVAASRPDLVFLEFAANDSDVRKLISLSASVANMEAIVDAFRKRNPAVIVYIMTMNPFSGPRSWIRPLRNRYEDAHRELARGLGIGHLDHRPAWGALEADEFYLEIADGVHPTSAAASSIVVSGIMARLWSDGIVSCASGAKPGR